MIPPGNPLPFQLQETERRPIPSLRVCHGERGLTLTSLLVSIAIISVLAALLFAGGRSLSQASQSVRCINNLRQLGVATKLYTAEHRGYLPFYYTHVKSTERNTFGYTGYWYWHLAPYLNIPRWESSKVHLGPEKRKLYQPNVFTCPAHGKNEVANPLVFPTTQPVSYAPSGEISAAMTPLPNQEDHDALVRGLRVADIPFPGQKAWLSDSTLIDSLNVSASRWTSDDDHKAWARVPFTRHNGAGNVLFYDGHVESVPYNTIVTGNLRENVLRLFSPLR